jgi:hypothetical protein
MQNNKKRRNSVSVQKAISLHAEANKSDPFAGARMSMTLRKGQDNQHKVAEAAQRVLTARKAAIKRAFNEWKKLNGQSIDALLLA